MSNLLRFNYSGQQMRTVTVDGNLEFVAADVCRILEHSNASAAVAGLDDDERGRRNVETPSGDQQMVTVTEAGLYSLIIRSRKPEAKTFRRWITHEVLPQIRKTGSFQVERLTPLQLAERLVDAERRVLAAQERNTVLSSEVAQLTPKAHTFDVFLGAAGDYSVGEAAKILCRDGGIEIGERRLFAFMESIGWIYRVKGKPIPYQSQIDNGRLVAKARWYTDDQTGEQVATTPQVRVTAKGLTVLRTKLLAGAA